MPADEFPASAAGAGFPELADEVGAAGWSGGLVAPPAGDDVAPPADGLAFGLGVPGEPELEDGAGLAEFAGGPAEGGGPAVSGGPALAGGPTLGGGAELAGGGVAGAGLAFG